MTRSRIINWWIARKLDSFHICLAAGGGFACLAGILTERPALAKGGGIFLLILAVVFLLHENLHRFWDYLENHQDLDRLPAGQMKRVNGFLLCCFLAVFLILVFLAGFFPWQAAGELLLSGVRAVFRFLASLLPESTEEYTMTQGGTGELFASMTAFAGEGEGNPFWDWISYILAAVIAVGFGLFLLYTAVRKLVEYLGSLSFDGDEKVFIKPEETAERRGRRGRRRSFLAGLMPAGGGHAERVRRLYQKSIRESLGPGGRAKERRFACMTPEQIEETAGIAEAELHQLYEKARYSRDGCSADDAARMAVCWRKIRKKEKSGAFKEEEL